MKNLLVSLLLSITLLLTITLQASFVNDANAGAPQVKKSGNITYINIDIYQPNVEDCYEVSVSEVGKENDWINIYPNPNPGLFTLELNLQQPMKALEIHMYDIAGKLVFQTRETPDGTHFHKDFDISFFQKGVYFLHITGNDRVGVKQIIIN